MEVVSGTVLSAVVEDILGNWKQRLQFWKAEDEQLQNLDVHSRGRNNTVLHLAARIGNKRMVEDLLTNDLLASLNSEHETPLHVAARSGHSEVVKVLIDWSESVSDVETEGGIGLGQQILRMKNMKGNTPLHEAARNGHHSTVIVLVEKLRSSESDLLVPPNNAGDSPLSMAVDAKKSKIVETILNNSDPTSQLLHRSSDGQTLLHRAILRADSKIMKSILQKSEDLMNKQDNYGRSPLHYAAASGALAMVNELLRRKPSYESFLDRHLATPAHMAAANGHVNVLRLFVKYSLFSIELLDDHDQNILHVAAQNGHVKVVRYIRSMFMVNDLLNETDKDGNTPLHLAAAKLHSSVVTTLVQTGNVDTRTLNNKRETALDIARNFQLVSPSNEVNEDTNSNQIQAIPNRIGGAWDEKIEAKKQRIIDILKAASAKQAEKLEGILEQEDLMTETIRDKRRKEMAGTLIVMATLVATVTFTAAFTLPGGLHSEGELQGLAVLARKAAFKAFIFTDTIAMTTSMTSAVILFTSSWNDEKNKWNLHFMALQMLWLSLASMGIAFLTGLFAVLSHSMELAIIVCFIGCLFPALLYLLGPLILPEEFVFSLMDVAEKIKTKIYSCWMLL